MPLWLHNSASKNDFYLDPAANVRWKKDSETRKLSNEIIRGSESGTQTPLLVAVHSEQWAVTSERNGTAAAEDLPRQIEHTAVAITTAAAETNNKEEAVTPTRNTVDVSMKRHLPADN